MNEFLKSYMPSLVVLPGDSKLAVALIESYKSIATFLVFLTDLANTLKQHTFLHQFLPADYSGQEWEYSFLKKAARRLILKAILDFRNDLAMPIPKDTTIINFSIKISKL